MPIDIRGRIPFTGKHPLSDTAIGRYASFFIQPPSPTTADAHTIVRAAREQERLGYDSSLIPQNSTRPDVWACSGWALAATRHLKLVAAHRIGLQAPTLAARTLATLDRLSGGRQQVHILQGRTDADMRRDGDFLALSDRYRRAEEYVRIFKQTLTAPQPFDFDGEFYRVKGAFSEIKPVQSPHPVLHFPGGSEAGQHLAARHADAWAVNGATVDEVKRAIEGIQAIALQHYGRRLERFWTGGFNLILADTEQAAWDRAEQIADEVESFIAAGRAAAPINTRSSAGAPPRPDREGESLYFRLSKLTGHGPSLVGTPDSVARTLLAYYDAGVTTVTLGGLCEYHSFDGHDLITLDDKGLLANLIATLRQGVARRDAARLQADAEKPTAEAA